MKNRPCINGNAKDPVFLLQWQNILMKSTFFSDLHFWPVFKALHCRKGNCKASSNPIEFLWVVFHDL